MMVFKRSNHSFSPMIHITKLSFVSFFKKFVAVFRYLHRLTWWASPTSVWNYSCMLGSVETLDPIVIIFIRGFEAQKTR